MADTAHQRQAEEWEAQWHRIGPVQFAAWGDRLLVIEDKFKSGYDCHTCGGLGTLTCSNCEGKGTYHSQSSSVEKKCSACEGHGQFKCKDCNGKGALLFIPQNAQRRPTTGRVVSVGEKVQKFKIGDNVMYSSYAGHAMDFPEPDGDATIVMHILHESEILSQVKGHLELSRVKNQREALGI